MAIGKLANPTIGQCMKSEVTLAVCTILLTFGQDTESTYDWANSQ
jgi:hypothetical protein